MKTASTLLLALSFALPLAGCPAGDDANDDGADTGNGPAGTAGDDGVGTTAADDAADDAPTSAADDAPGTSAGDDAVDSTTAADDTTGGSGGAGFCGPTCTAPADCGKIAEDWECTDGFCVSTLPPLDPCDPTICPEAAGFACFTVDGADRCAIACPNGDECGVAMQECTGMDDAAAAFCEAPPCNGVAEGEACEVAGFGQIGTCTDGVCSCTADSECTAEGWGCNPG